MGAGVKAALDFFTKITKNTTGMHKCNKTYSLIVYLLLTAMVYFVLNKSLYKDL